MGKPLFVLDSSAIIGHLNRELDVDACIGPDVVRCASVVGFMETLAKPGITAAQEAEARRFLSGGEVIDLTPAIRDEAIIIRRSCKLKLPDAIIAATAVILNATLLSNDDHFYTLVWPGFSVRRINSSNK
jgi:predicted nucleic acid-binding protein